MCWSSGERGILVSILTAYSGLAYRLGDIREGRCDRGIFYNQVVCCSGLDCEHRISECIWSLPDA